MADDRPLRILVVTPSYPTASCPWGGIFIKLQVEALRRMGHRVDVFRVSHAHLWPFNLLSQSVPEPEIWETDERGNHSICVEGRILPRHLTMPDWLFRPFHRRVNAEALKAVERLKPDLVHFHVTRSVGYFYSVLRRYPDLPTVITSHGGDTRFGRGLFWFRPVLRRGMARVGRVIAVGERIRADCRRMGISTDNMVVIGNGIPAEIVRPKTDRWTPGCGRPLRLVAVCNLIPLKGTDDTLKAMKRLTDRGYDLELRVTGKGPERGRLEALALELGLTDRVTFLGGKAHEDAIDEIYAADLFCMPSWDEGFGVVYVEAMGQGVPVIACRGQGIQNVVEESQAGVLVPGKDPEALAEAIAALVDQPEHLAAMGDRGYEFVRSGYTWDAVAAKITALYREVLAEKDHSWDQR